MQAVNAIFFSHCLMLCNAILTCCKLLHLSVVFITNFYIKLWYVTNPCSFSCAFHMLHTHPQSIAFILYKSQSTVRFTFCKYNGLSSAWEATALSPSRVECESGESVRAGVMRRLAGCCSQSARTWRPRRPTRTTACSWPWRRARRCGAASRAARRCPTAGITSTRTRRSARPAPTARPPTAASTRCARTCGSSTPRCCSNTKYGHDDTTTRRHTTRTQTPPTPALTSEHFFVSR